MPTSSKPDRFKLIAAVYVLFVRDEKILMLRRAKNAAYEAGNYSLVAGHADGNESLTAATAREAMEEAGVTIAPADLRLKVVMHRIDEPGRARFLFCARRVAGRDHQYGAAQVQRSPLVPAGRLARQHHSLHPRGDPLLSRRRGVCGVGAERSCAIISPHAPIHGFSLA